MSITILKTALEVLKLIVELLAKPVTRLAALVRSRRRARPQCAQSISTVPYRRGRPWIDRRVAMGANFAGIDRSPATSTDDVSWRPVPEQQPIAPLTTRPVPAKKLIRR